MFAKQLLNSKFSPLHLSDPASTALARMDAWQTYEIPVINPATLQLEGVVRHGMISDLADESVTLDNFELDESVAVYENQHIFEIARRMLQHELRFIVVIDDTGSYAGIIDKKELLEALTSMLNVSTSGSVITVEMARADFTLSKLVHVIETEGAKILGLTVENVEDESAILQISIKLDLQDTSAVVSSLERHGYVATTENRFDVMQTDLSSRADELLRYLDL